MKTPRLSRALALALSLAGCHAGTPPAPHALGPSSPVAVTAAGAALADEAAAACPFPESLDKYEETNFAERTRETPAADLGLLKSVRSGCAIMTFTVSDTGLVLNPKVVSSDSLAFALVAPKVIRWVNFAHGADSSAVFMVRLGAQMQTDGSGLLSFAFKDWTVDLAVPR